MIGEIPPECNVSENILYFNGSRSQYSQDHNLRLHFDVYRPWDPDPSLPGQNATIIRIHGGYWVGGDTKMMVQQCRYFASQGYIVFDIQYGLYNNTSNDPGHIKGNFTHDDMVRHVGNFTHYLADHAGEYGADLSNVIAFGASAGTTLAMGIVFGQADPRFSEWIASGIEFRGIYLFYPASGLQKNQNIKGREDLLYPENLVGPSSPPCLIFAGTRDQLVKSKIPKRIQQKYQKQGERKCPIVWLWQYPHAFVWNEYNSASQLSRYYTERFLKALIS
jgi:acetyl esterase/lipase